MARWVQDMKIMWAGSAGTPQEPGWYWVKSKYMSDDASAVIEVVAGGNNVVRRYPQYEGLAWREAAAPREEYNTMQELLMFFRGNDPIFCSKRPPPADNEIEWLRTNTPPMTQKEIDQLRFGRMFEEPKAEPISEPGATRSMSLRCQRPGCPHRRGDHSRLAGFSDCTMCQCKAFLVIEEVELEVIEPRGSVAPFCRRPECLHRRILHRMNTTSACRSCSCSMFWDGPAGVTSTASVDGPKPGYRRLKK